MEAEIITIGTEILLGEIVDTNTRTLARRLRDIGVDIFLTSTVGDNPRRIADAVRASASRADLVITTGGLGPTIDDATREGIADAMGIELVFSEDLWQQIQDRFAQFGRVPTENNRRQAQIPLGAIAIENPVGTAPSFILEAQDATVIALPGVPGEMMHLLESEVIPYIKRKLGSFEVIHTRLLRTAGLGESILDERIADLEQLSNPTVGLSAHPGRVDIRITAKARSPQAADEMLWGIQATLQQRLGRHIYGMDEDTLEGVVLNLLREKGLTLATAETGTGGLLQDSLGERPGIYLAGVQRLPSDLGGSIEDALAALLQECGASVGLGLRLTEEDGQGSALEIVVQLPDRVEKLNESCPAIFVNMDARAVSYALDLLRRSLLDD
ncbi:MAG: CinA family nicotinamide mononucleotide deamidase-related protein [Anaerolineales bacterium]|nr:CinA family nicotinamide mononucleotide deamidase-related protein [Anaerolineales bacterium]